MTSTLSESAGASGLLPCPFCGTAPRWFGAFPENKLACPKCLQVSIKANWYGGDLGTVEACWNTRAAPVQAEPVAYQFRQRSGASKGHQNKALWCHWCFIDEEDYRRYAAEPSPRIEVRALYASPPTPVPGEATDIEIAKTHCMCGARMDGHSTMEGHTPVSMFDYDRPTPLSAGLDDIGKQNGSEEPQSRKQSS